MPPPGSEDGSGVTAQPPVEPRSSWSLGDDPVGGGAGQPDSLGRGGFIRHVAAVLNRVRQQSESSVIGIVADWGAGKTSIVNLVREALEGPADGSGWLIAEYNPWSYSDLESLIMGFFAELRAAIPKEGRGKQTRERIGGLATAVAPIGKLAGLIGVDLEPVMKAAGKYIAGDVSVSAKRAQAEEALQDLGRPILVILDDLDRLAPDELLLVFKLVRLVGRLPNTYYLLCYDEQTLLDVLEKSSLVSSRERALDYMEKIVQVRIDVPPLREPQISQGIDTAVGAILGGEQLERVDIDRIAEAYRAHLRTRLTTPRSIRRLFAQVDAFYAPIKDEVNFTDYLLLTFVRTFEPGVFRMLHERREELIKQRTRSVSSAGRDPATADGWRQRLRAAGTSEENADGMLGLLAVLFVPVKEAMEHGLLSSGYMADLARRRCIGHPDYFDRYFAFSVPDEDIADSVVAAALQQLTDHDLGDEVDQLDSRLRTDTSRVVRKLRALRSPGPESAEPLIRLLGGAYDQLPLDSLFTTRPHLDIALLTCSLLDDLPEEEGARTLRALAETDAGAELAGRAVRTLLHAGPGGQGTGLPSLTWISTAKEVDLELIKTRLTRAASEPLAAVGCSLFRELLYGWHDLAPSEVTAWLWEQIAAGRWSLIGFIVHYSSNDTAQDGHRLPYPILQDLNWAEIGGLLDLERVLGCLREELDTAEAAERPETADGPAAEHYVLWQLRELRGRLAVALDAGQDVAGEDDTEQAS
jgi:KAP family P-loop domain